MDRLWDAFDGLIPEHLLPYKHIILSSSILASLALWKLTRTKPNAIKTNPEDVAAKVEGVPAPGPSPESPEYDFVIVGGGEFLCILLPVFASDTIKGTAGCVLASRLTEDPNISVLVLEAGTR